MKTQDSRIAQIKAIRSTAGTKRRRFFWTAAGLIAASSYPTFLNMPLGIAVVLGALTTLSAINAYESDELKRRLDSVLELLLEESSTSARPD